MNKFVVIVSVSLLFSTITSLYAQNDSTQTKPDRPGVLDSLSALSSKQWVTDSLTVLSWSDSLKIGINKKFTSDSLGIRHTMDSLQELQLSTEQYAKKLDSLTAKKTQLLSEVNTSQDKLLSKTKNRLQQWQNKIKSKLGLDSLSANTGMNIPNLGTPDVPGLNVPGVDIPQTDLASLEIPEMPSLSATDFKDLELSPDLSSINESLSFGELDGLSEIQEKLGDMNEVMSKAGDLTKNTDKAIESGVGEIAEVKAVQEQLKLGEGIQQNEFMDKAQQLKDPEAMKEALKQQALQKAVDHFAGKEVQLQKAMEQVAKYKQKYASLNSIKDIPKRKPNEMRGKPLIERLVPGIALQIQHKNDLLVDFNPYVGYRLSGRLTSGIGWNQRVAYNTGNHDFNAKARIFGPRAYSEFRVWKGFFPRAEIEVMNTFVPPLIKGSAPDAGQREWVWSAMIGLKKDYRFIKKVRGTAFIMFNLFNSHHKSPYVDVLNMRFGFEFPMKKKKKTESPEVGKKKSGI